MAIIPKKGVNFDIERRADFPLSLTFKDSTGSAMNLTGYNVAVQCWNVINNKRKTKYADFGVTYTDRSAGKVDIKLTDEQTATFNVDELQYDVLLTEPSGDKFYYFEGTLFISEGVTS